MKALIGSRKKKLQRAFNVSPKEYFRIKQRHVMEAPMENLLDWIGGIVVDYCKKKK